MIVDCPSCGATYNISDEKVRGRRVRVRCKNCSGPIIVDGELIDADDATRVYQPSLEPNTYEETRVYKPTLEPNTYEDTDESTRVMTVGGDQADPNPGAWTVNVSESDQRTMTLEELVDTYNSGFITEEAFVWRDGMSDWVPLMEVEEIRSAIESNQATHVVKPAVMRAQARRSAVNPPTPISYAAPAAAPPRARLVTAPASSVEYAPPPRALPSSPEPARLRGGRNAAQDLFGGIATAGSEQELISNSSLPRQDSREKATGARNESSVLFSLNTVRAGVGPTSAPPRGLGAAPPPPQTAAEILGMDLSGGLPGVDLNAALATAPIAEPPPQRITTPPARGRMDTLPPTMRRRGRPLLIAAVVFIASAMLAGLAYVVRARHPADTTPAAAEPLRTGEPIAAAPPTAPPTSPTEQAPSSAPGASANAAPSEPAPAPSAAAPAAPAPPGPQLHPLPAPVAAPRGGPGRPSPQPNQEKAAAKPEGAGKGDQKIVLEEEGSEAPAPAGGKAAPKEVAPSEAPPDPERPPFDMSAAKAALEGAASSAASCKNADGPTGRGKVQVTFSPSGRVTSANVVEGAFGGTPVGGCVAKLFRGAKVPAFSGDPVTVAKAFTIPE